MKLLGKRDSEDALKSVMKILQIVEDIPIDALGNSADAVKKMTVLYNETSKIAYTVGGVDGLNACIEFFKLKARNMDEILAISDAHIETIAKYRRKSKRVRRK